MLFRSVNLADMLHVTDVEGETCHRRTLRFLNLHYRAVHRILQRVDAIFVDFHNQRLHAVVAKPYDSADLAEKILELLANPTERATFGERGRAKVMSRYTWEHVTNVWEATLQKAAAAR